MRKCKHPGEILRALSDAEHEAVADALCSTAFAHLIGSEDWNLHEDQERLLWPIIQRLEAAI